MSRAERDVADAVLVVRARAGDKEAFGLLIGRHQAMARTVARRVLRDADLAADAVQEAAATALVGLDRLQDADRFAAWLCGIALNIARTWTRQHQPTARSASLRTCSRPTRTPVGSTAIPPPASSWRPRRTTP